MSERTSRKDALVEAAEVIKALNTCYGTEGCTRRSCVAYDSCNIRRVVAEAEEYEEERRKDNEEKITKITTAFETLESYMESDIELVLQVASDSNKSAMNKAYGEFARDNSVAGTITKEALEFMKNFNVKDRVVYGDTDSIFIKTQ